jgi:DNA mismatch endonuclease (patch repair protein)
VPDVVLPKYRSVIFVNGCFWHRHPNCPFAYTPKTRTKFWKRKFGENVARHSKVTNELEAMGWHVVTIWECDISDRLALSQKLSESLPRIGSVRSVIE